MSRTDFITFLTLVLVLGNAPSGLGQELAGDATPAQGPSGSLEEAYATWTASLEDDGSWELQMPPAEVSEDLERLSTTLLEAPEGQDMDSGLKAGYLVALADRTALEGDRDRARTLYGVLQTSEVSQLKMWSVYMLAGLDFAEGHYGNAAVSYDQVCSESAPADWREHACSMAGLAQRLDALKLEGGDHGHAVAPTP